MTIVRRPAGAMGLFALIALGLSAPAFAESDLIVNYQPDIGSVTRTLRVDISDLSLATPSGRAKLENRVTIAARKVCDYNRAQGLTQPKDYKRCFSKAKGDALSDARLVQTASR